MYHSIVVRNVSLYGFSDDEVRMKHIIRFINQSYPDNTSLLDVPDEDYVAFLLNNNIIKSAKAKDGTRINGNMEIVPVKRVNRTATILQRIRKVITEYHERNIPEQKKDFWVTKNFPFVKDMSTQRHNLDFKDIPQPYIKEQLKEYCYFKLKAAQKTGNIYQTLSRIKVFAKWLYEFSPEYKDFSNLDRDIIEEYLGWLRIESGFQTYQINNHILALKIFLEECLQLEYENIPTIPLILSKDYRFKRVRKVEYYSKEKMRRINAVIAEFPPVYATILYCFQVLALRMSDLMTLTPDMIQKVYDEEDATLFRFQIKTHHSISICLEESDYMLLMDQYEESKSLYGENVKYIFADGPDSYISQLTVSRNLNKLFYDYKIMGDDGNILRFKSHKFRATKATLLIASGFGAVEGKKALGHSGLQSLSFYTSVQFQVIIDSLRPFVNKTEVLINNIGKIKDIRTEEFENALSLCNGWCCRPTSLGVCEHANYCLSCDLFKPDIRHKNYYELQLQELEATLEVSKNIKNELLEKKTLADIEKLKKIIERVDELCQKET